MQVVINGEHRSLDGVATIAELISHMQLEGRVAVEVNRQIVPRSRFQSHPLKDGDVIEMVRAIGGG